jgi:hypothetical protein
MALVSPSPFLVPKSPTEVLLAVLVSLDQQDPARLQLLRLPNPLVNRRKLPTLQK